MSYQLSLSKEIRHELLEATPPSEPLVVGTLRFIEIHVDAEGFQFVHHLPCAEVLFRSTAHEHILHLLVILRRIVKHTVETGLHVHAEEGTTESAEIGELVKIGQHGVKGLAPRPQESPAIARFSRSVFVRKILSIMGMRSLMMTS